MGALAARELLERISHILRRIAVACEYRFVDVQRIDIHTLIVHIGVRQHRVVEDLAQRTVRNHLVAAAPRHRQSRGHEQYGYHSFHIVALSLSMAPTVRRVTTCATTI